MFVCSFMATYDLTDSGTIRRDLAIGHLSFVHQLLTLVASPHVFIYATVRGTWEALILWLHDQWFPLVLLIWEELIR